VPCGAIRIADRPGSLCGEFLLESEQGKLVAYLFLEETAGIELTTPLAGVAVSEGDIVLF
jgi:hypothetical protein